MFHPKSAAGDEDGENADYFSEAEEVYDQDEEDEHGNKIKKPVKVKNVVRKPQLKLDPSRLCGDRGIRCLLDMLNKFKGKQDGNEFKDLDFLVSKYEYWAHRLFPKMKFCDVIERLEKLGERREVKSQLYNIRLGINPGGTETQEGTGDQAVQDEEMANQVMEMMNNINGDDHGEDDYYGTHVFPKSTNSATTESNPAEKTAADQKFSAPAPEKRASSTSNTNDNGSVGDEDDDDDDDLDLMRNMDIDAICKTQSGTQN